MALVTTQQFPGLTPNILGGIQQGLVNRQLIQQEENKLRLREQAAGQLATRQRALGVSEVKPTDESQVQARLRMIADNPALANKQLATIGIIDQRQKEDAAAFAENTLNAPPELRKELISQRIRFLDANDRDSSHSMILLDLEGPQLEASLNGLKVMALTALQRRAGGFTAGQREFTSMTAGLSAEDKEKARRIDLGLDARATARTAAREGAIAQVVGDIKVTQEIRKAVGVESGKLITQRKLKPQVETAVFNAVAQAKDVFDISKQQRSNRVALNLYNVGMKGLIDSLSGTETGPFVGFTPAVTANQQIADGAVAAMAPILKQMFRASGEGVFTDKDQELLLQMVPTRKDRPKSIKAKLSNIDAIVRAKLLTDVDQLPQGVSEEDIVETMRANNMSRQQVLERLGGQ